MNEQQVSATWYMVSHYYTNKITPVTVEKETAKTVSVVGKYGGTRAFRSDKQSAHEAFFPTWEEAHAYLLGRCEAKVTGCRRALELANSELGNVKGMKAPARALPQGAPDA